MRLAQVLYSMLGRLPSVVFFVLQRQIFSLIYLTAKNSSCFCRGYRYYWQDTSSAMSVFATCKHCIVSKLSFGLTLLSLVLLLFSASLPISTECSTALLIL